MKLVTATETDTNPREREAELAHALHGLTPEEIQIVESSSAPASARHKGAAK